jgi:hypothetical protein
VICDAGLDYCSGNEVRECDASGTAFTLLDTCDDAQFCRAGERACLPDVCSPLSSICAGNLLTRCRADGSGPEPGGSDCGATAVCDLGACHAVVCAPNQRLCDAGDVYLCNATGTDEAIYDNCDPREYCDASSPGAAACVPDQCLANAPACQSEWLATCNSDGSAAQSPTLDCSASGQVCDLSGSCQPQAIDLFGTNATPQSVTSYTAHFVILRVTTPRTLKQLTAQISVGSPDPVAWLVYRSDTLLGPYNNILLASVPPVMIDGKLGLPAQDLPLETDAYYLVGVGVPAPHDVEIQPDAAPMPLSFGQILGGYELTLSAGEGAIPRSVRIGVGEIGDGVGLSVRTGG